MMFNRVRCALRNEHSAAAAPIVARRRASRVARICAALTLVLSSAAPALAQLQPNPASPRHNTGANTNTPNPALASATSNAAATKGTIVSLTENPATIVNPVNANTPGTPWLMPALTAAALPYVNAQNTYTYSFATLNGTMMLNDYEAYADNAPNLILGGNQLLAANRPGRGGAAFAINYSPRAGDPTAAQLNSLPNGDSPITGGWIQVIDSNMPSMHGTTYGAAIAGGTTAYLDNGGNGAPIDPYYGHGAQFTFSNSTGFADRTNFPLTDVGLVWQAVAFPASEVDTTNMMTGVTNHAITIYSGVAWGFSIRAAAVPEPSTWALLLSGVAGVALAVRERRGGQAVRA